MKRLLCIILCFVLIFAVSTPAVAEGDGNMDGGGGSVGDGTGQNFWNPGDDGVRISIIRVSDNKRYKGPVDFTNQNPIIAFYFDKKSKVDYRGGVALTARVGSGYMFTNPSKALPNPIISSSGASNIAAIKEYFTDELAIKYIAQEVGMTYADLIGGKYKLLIEPLAFFTYGGFKFAATAHEVALYDQVTSGDLRSKLGNLTHKNLPLAIFLETSDLGFPAWGGTATGFVANSDIISSLGLGIVRFNELPPEGEGGGPGVELPDYEYHTDIDVITSFLIHGGSSGVSPDDGGEVTFTVNGSTQRQSYVAPPDETQLVWFQWHTPEEPQQLTIDVSVSGGGSVAEDRMTVDVVELVELTPPDPQPLDKKPYAYMVRNPPSRPNVSSLTWGVWIPEWEENWVWEENWEWDSSWGFDELGNEVDYGDWVDNGDWVDMGKWIYYWESYSASLYADMLIEPDSRVPTAYTGSYGKVYMGSGYGVNIEMKPSYSGRINGTVTYAQNAIAYFPEFEYKTYNRVLEKTIDNFTGTVFEFKENLYSQVRHRVHFTPLWMPDDLYEVQAELIDCWTPAGMLRVSESYDNLYIDGTVYDDWRWVAH